MILNIFHGVVFSVLLLPPVHKARARFCNKRFKCIDFSVPSWVRAIAALKCFAHVGRFSKRTCDFTVCSKT